MKLKNQNTLINLVVNTAALVALMGVAPRVQAMTSQSGLTKTSMDVLPTVAVIDTGADIHHSILKDQIWTNPGESGFDKYGRDKSNNNIDDDLNGYIDDVHGWNFLAGNNDISDHVGHGTHIAGIIISQSKVASKQNQHAPVKLMILKFFDNGATGEKVLNATAQAIEYAVKMNATFINYSAGGRTSSKQEYQALLKAKDKNIIVIAAAGNDHTDNDLLPFFPASYRLSNILAVAAIDSEGKLLPTSNFGKLSVSTKALGKDILSSLPGEKMGKMTGTSQATAMVTAQMVSEKFRLASIQRGIEEVEKVFQTEIILAEQKTKVTEVAFRKPLDSNSKQNLSKYLSK